MDLKFERPRLVNETEPKPSEPVVPVVPDEAKEEVARNPDEIVAAFLDNPHPDLYSIWAAQEAFELTRLRKLQSGNSPPDPDAGAHVCAELVRTDRNVEELEVQDPRATEGPPGG